MEGHLLDNQHNTVVKVLRLEQRVMNLNPQCATNFPGDLGEVTIVQSNPLHRAVVRIKRKGEPHTLSLEENWGTNRTTSSDTRRQQGAQHRERSLESLKQAEPAQDQCLSHPASTPDTHLQPPSFHRLHHPAIGRVLLVDSVQEIHLDHVLRDGVLKAVEHPTPVTQGHILLVQLGRERERGILLCVKTSPPPLASQMGSDIEVSHAGFWHSASAYHYMLNVVWAHPPAEGHRCERRLQAVHVEQKRAVIALDERGYSAAPEGERS